VDKLSSRAHAHAGLRFWSIPECTSGEVQVQFRRNDDGDDDSAK
jgi:hypothetical protein